MKRTYELTINGADPTIVEKAISMMDAIVRDWYDVPGGKRTYSGRGAGDDYFVFVEYTADWDETGRIPNWDDLKRMYFFKATWLAPYELGFSTRLVPGKN